METKTEIDLNLCAEFVRAIADQLRDEFIPPSADDDIRALVNHLRLKNDEANLQLRTELDARYPHVSWALEETSLAARKSGSYWIYDPIDGAYHYLQGLPLWSSSLTLVQNGEPILAMVYDPALREMFTASAGCGATLNGRAIHVSSKPGLRTAVLATAIPPTGAGSPQEQTQALDQLKKLCQRVFVIRQMGSASLQLAYVAVGRLDGYWEVGHDINDWLAGSLLVCEAGGRVTNFVGSTISATNDGIIATSSGLHEPIRQALQMHPVPDLTGCATPEEI